MERQTQVVLGGVLAAAGVGAVAYVASQYLKSRSAALVRNASVTTEPPGPLQAGTRMMTLTVTWENPTSKSVTYGVQAATIDGDLVSGHWFTTQETARDAVLKYQQGDIHGSQILASNPFYRVPYVTVGPGQRGQVQLHEVITLQPGQVWFVWIQTANGGRLIVDDLLGTHVTSLPESQAAVKVQVT